MGQCVSCCSVNSDRLVEEGPHGTLEFDRSVLGEGGTRYAMRGEVVAGTFGHFEKSTPVVVKVIKPEKQQQGLRITEADIRA